MNKVGTYQMMEHSDEVHGDGDVLKMIKLQLEKKKKKNKNKVDQVKCIKYIFIFALKTPYKV